MSDQPANVSNTSVPPIQLLPPAALNYQSAPGAIQGTVWQMNNILYVTNQAVLPGRCVKCNSDVDVRMKRKTFAWFPQWVYLLILFNLLVCAVVALVLQRKITMTFGVCAAHRNKHLVSNLICTFVLLMCIVAVGVSINEENPLLAIAAIVVFLGTLIFLAIRGPILKVSTIQKNGVAEFSKISPAFLSQLPGPPWAQSPPQL